MGPDNRFFLERNTLRLKTWMYKILAQNNNLKIGSKTYKIKFTCAADWVSLDALFGPVECFFVIFQMAAVIYV
jgi:hypothetical protein